MTAEMFNQAAAKAMAAGDAAGALVLLDRALAERPDSAALHANRGIALQLSGDVTGAIAAYRAALGAEPGHPVALCNLGNALCECGRDEAALEILLRATQVCSSHGEAWLNLGSALRRLERLHQAVRVYIRGLRAIGADARLLAGLGHAFAALDRPRAAIAAYRKSLALDADQPRVAAYCLHQLGLVCDWRSNRPPPPEPDARPADPADPFAMLAIEDDPARQLARSRAWARAMQPGVVSVAPMPAQRPDGRLVIGYVSPDFHDHATMHLLAGVLRCHDRQRFAIHAYCLGRGVDDAMAAHVRAHVDRFVPIAAMDEASKLAQIRSDGVAIAVDLLRTAWFARRAAPVQIAWLGYPGSLGSPAYDYLIADRVVLPTAERAHYDEAVITLPQCYQPNDNARAIAPDPGTRADHGLPDDVPVLCCFNQGYKITAEVFAVWMALMRDVPDSVLWLLAWNRPVVAALRAEAALAGVDPARLVFAPRAAQADHLARHVHADLLLDTWPVGAHTACSDALWAGLPVLTCAGRQFAARVGASLLRAIGLPELIATSPADYAARARALLHDRALLAGLRARLSANRLNHPLFDTAGFTRALEAAYATAWSRRCAGLAPADIA